MNEDTTQPQPEAEPQPEADPQEMTREQLQVLQMQMAHEQKMAAERTRQQLIDLINQNIPQLVKYKTAGSDLDERKSSRKSTFALVSMVGLLLCVTGLSALKIIDGVTSGTLLGSIVGYLFGSIKDYFD